MPLLVIFLSFHYFPMQGQVVSGQWTWIKGDNIIDQLGVYGSSGVAAPSNKPGARQYSATWTDATGKFWLFGGLGYDGVSGPSSLNDLWRYDPSVNQWTWLKGDNTSGQYGVYGTQGIAAAANKPGGRYGCITWLDGSGNMWLFGGTGMGASGAVGRLNDLWKYDTTLHQWAWIKGDNTINQSGSYGTLGTPSLTNKPGGRIFSASWIDNNGLLWLFGGNGYDAGATTGQLADLWKFDPATSMWTWIKGNSTINSLAAYGTLGIPAAGNNPGARNGAVAWNDGSGSFWLFGGSGYDGASSGSLNDLWKYDVSSGQWAWIKGDNIINQYGIYGSQGVESVSNKPGGRNVATGWKDLFGNLWLVGGAGYAASGASGYLNDLWKYDIVSNQWTWVKDNNIINQAAVYGTMGTPSAANRPGAAQGSSSWRDKLGNLWLFGGLGHDGTGALGYLNSLLIYGNETFVWIGVTSTDWNTATNWSGGVVPSILDEVLIPSGTSFSPIITTGIAAACKDMTVLTGATVTVNVGGNLTISH